MTSWIITVPKTIDWNEYQREIDAVQDYSQVMNYKLPFLPKGMTEGDRCYITWNGKVRGWMQVMRVGYKPTFRCSTTGREWPAGNYMERSGPFHAVPESDYPGFRGIRRFEVE